MLSFPHSLGNNSLGQTGYVNKSKVQGTSFEVGAKVTYGGREMTVSKGVDSDNELKMFDLSGVAAIAVALQSNVSLTSIKCALILH